MAGIYISGGSGLGKTSFVKLMERTYGVQSITNVIRTINKKHQEVQDLKKEDRQFIYEYEYLKLLHISSFNFLSDRSVLDVFVWSDRNPEVVKYLGVSGHPPDLLIVLPTPSFEWYKKHIDHFTRDMIRLNAYRDLFRVKHSEHLSEDEIAQFIYTIERNFEQKIRQMCDFLEWPYFVPEAKRDDIENFQTHWQMEAEEAILQTWGMSRIEINMLGEDKEKYNTYKERLKLLQEERKLQILEKSLHDENIFSGENN